MMSSLTHDHSYLRMPVHRYTSVYVCVYLKTTVSYISTLYENDGTLSRSNISMTILDGNGMEETLTQGADHKICIILSMFISHCFCIAVRSRSYNSKRPLKSQEISRHVLASIHQADESFTAIFCAVSKPRDSDFRLLVLIFRWFDTFAFVLINNPQSNHSYEASKETQPTWRRGIVFPNGCDGASCCYTVWYWSTTCKLKMLQHWIMA